MISKSDLLNKHKSFESETDGVTYFDGYPDTIYAAMEEWAKEIAIGFHNWREENYLDITYDYHNEDGGDDIYIPRVIPNWGKPPRYTVEELFNQFLKTIKTETV